MRNFRQIKTQYATHVKINNCRLCSNVANGLSTDPEDQSTVATDSGSAKNFY